MTKSSLHVLLVLCLVACQAEPRDPGEREERIVLLLETPPRDLDPRFVSDSSSTKISKLIFAGLTTVETPDLTPIPDLAQSVEPACEEGPRDCTHWIVTLREGLFWHDGVPVRAHDAVYTWRTLLDPSLGSPFSGDLRKKIARVWAEGDRRIHFELKDPDALFALDLAIGLVPAHLLEGTEPPQRLTAYVGTGPYRYESRYGDVKVTLERNPEYHGPKPPARWLVARVIRDEATRMLSVLAGSADLAVNNLSPPLIRSLQDEPGLRIEAGPASCTTYMAMNLTRSPLDRRDVRKALALALDRRGIVTHMYHGRARLAAGILPPLHWAFHGAIEPPPYDVEGAERLLDQAGIPRDPETGIRMTLTLKVTTDRFRTAVGRILADQLAAVGVEVETVPTELSTLLSDVRQGNFDLYVLQVPEVIDPDILRWLFHSQGTPVPAGGIGDTEYGRLDRRFLPPGYKDIQGPFAAECEERWVPWVEARAGEYHGIVDAGGTLPFTTGNRSFFTDPEVDCLLDLGRRTPTREDRIRYYRRIQEILAAELPLLPLWHEDNVAVMSRRLEGYEILPINRYRPLTGTRLEESEGTGR
ncbi:MAG: ABC transporter substrate-binding protein [Pseudomonadota bacterium]